MFKLLNYLSILLVSMVLVSCGGGGNKSGEGTSGQDAAKSANKLDEIRSYNLDVKSEQASKKSPCDTVNVLKYVFKNYPHGSYVVDFDKTLTFNIPKPALIYLHTNGTYIFAVVAMSKPGERFIEPKNIVGYDQSFIDLDSTKLGTAFFYLTLFKCEDSTFSKIWEVPIPSDGGFNYFHMERWSYNGTPYIKVDFHYARGTGHIDYNYFFINGYTSPPHLLMTYEGYDYKRTIANVNGDEYPDYYEHIYYNLADRVYSPDSVAFVWNTKKNVYVNTRNHRQTRPY